MKKLRTTDRVSSYGEVTLVTWRQGFAVPPHSCCKAIFVSLQGSNPPACLPGEARWRCCWVNSPPCTFVELRTGLKLSCWLAHYEAVETVGSLCTGDAALLSYSWWFSSALLAFFTTGVAGSRPNESWHADWLLHVHHGAVKKKRRKGLALYDGCILLCPRSANVTLDILRKWNAPRTFNFPSKWLQDNIR